MLLQVYWSMIMSGTMGAHALAVTTLLLIGVPSNSAIIWIHTRKNSRVARNKFPLIFAGLDLCAILTALPLHPFFLMKMGFHSTLESIISKLFNVCFLFAMNGYLMTLLMATIDKFYAVRFPHKYGLKRAKFLKIATALSTVISATIAVTLVLSASRTTISYLRQVYSIVFILTFVTTIILYIVIIASLIKSGRKLRTVGHSAIR